jgi:L-alanine-DL-glutamate epimerase-like enolase superfamily enzyme
MKIRSVSTAVVEANFDWTLIRIEAEDGTVGLGESFFAPGLTQIIREMGRLLVGHDARNVNAVIDRLRLAASGAGSVGGIVHNALSGIDAALWDLNARQLGIPLWRLLGGRYRDKVRVYVDCHSSEALMSLGPMLDLRPSRWVEGAPAAPEVTMLFDPGAEPDPLDLEVVAARARHVVGQGFDMVKFDLDVPGIAPEQAGSRTMPRGGEALVRDLVQAIRESCGPDVDLAFDCHWRYDVASAMRIAETLADERIAWLEDPLPPENVKGLIDLSTRTAVPLGGGENMVTFAAVEPLVEAQALAVVTPDMGKVGGFREVRRISERAADRGLVVAPHNIAGPVGTMFAAHVAATMPSFLALEWHAFDVPFFDSLVGEQVIVDGGIAMSDRPGLGLDLALDEVARWSKPGEPVFG